MDRHAPPQPTSSIPATENTVWADASPLLEAACRELRDGELVHGENFNLFAAMSALEIMDPKMDSGIISRYCSVDEAIEDGAAPIPISFDKTVDVQCIIDIMDYLLAYCSIISSMEFILYDRHVYLKQQFHIVRDTGAC
ncbi:hypothetical protein GH714_041450 [Hevea brasiliensis]|uniref:NAA35-like N-terminal domain-containing protein n=1 Tax=Hevea brasiliensis TaxID=3981 RepID=A0A6A6MY96_HEVBR|nr:hypothetical protein GH714_041450 [Hevea brasiliensis]